MDVTKRGGWGGVRTKAPKSKEAGGRCKGRRGKGGQAKSSGGRGSSGFKMRTGATIGAPRRRRLLPPPPSNGIERANRQKGACFQTGTLRHMCRIGIHHHPVQAIPGMRREGKARQGKAAHLAGQGAKCLFKLLVHSWVGRCNGLGASSIVVRDELLRV